MNLKNKKADLPILVVVLLIVLALSSFTIFQFAKNKKNTDAVTINTLGLDILYSKETQLNLQFTEILEAAVAKAFNKIMNTQIFSTEQGTIAEKISGPFLNQEFKKELKNFLNEEIDKHLRLKGDLTEEFTQIKSFLNNPLKNSISFSDNNEDLLLTIEDIKLLAIHYDTAKKETFRAIYNAKIQVKVNLISLGLIKLSQANIQSIYQNCINKEKENPENKINLCLSSQLPNFNTKIDFEYIYKPSSTLPKQNQQPSADYEYTYLYLESKRKFHLGKDFRPMSFKVLVDIKEIPRQ